MFAIGMIEVRGLVALAAALDAICKTASSVQCLFVQRVSNGYLVAGIRGGLAAVQEALEAACEAVKRRGELRSAQIYPQLHPSATTVVESLTQSPFAAILLANQKPLSHAADNGERD